MKHLHPTPAPRRRGGGPLILVAATAFVLIGLTGLALDLAWIRSTEQQLQASADAASLAAARLVRTDSEASQFALTRQAAVNAALANQAAKANVIVDPNPTNAPTGDVVVGTWDIANATFVPGTTAPNAVRVTARRVSGTGGGPLTLFFGKIFGTPTSDVSRAAVARADLSNSPLLLLLSNNSNALDLRGNSTLAALGGNIQVNSPKDCAVQFSGNPTLTAASVNVAGTACLSNGTLNGALNEGVPSQPDPLAHIPPPSFAPPMLPTISGSGTYTPGYYDGISFNGGTATLTAGVYVIGNQGIDLAGNASLQGDGVMIYLPKPAKFDVTGNASIRLTGPQNGVYAGLTLFQDRNVALKNTIGGNASIDMEGTCYLFCSTLDAVGSGSPTADIGRLIAWSTQLSGTADVEITGLGLGPLPTASKPILTQ